MAGRVLLVEDDQTLRQTLTKALELGGYSVVQAESISEGTLSFSEMINCSGTERLDLMIVDLGLPDGDGSSLIRWVREQSSVTLIIISARYDDNSKVNLLDAGADDYMVKPFSFTEMMARYGSQCGIDTKMTILRLEFTEHRELKSICSAIRLFGMASGCI